MKENLKDWIKLAVFTPGRRIHAHLGVRRRAQAMGVVELVGHINGAVAHDYQVLDLQQRLLSQQATAEPTVVPSVGANFRADRVLSGYKSTLDDVLKVAEAGSAPAVAAQAVLDAVFPTGVSALIHIPHEDQIARVGALLNRLRPDPGAADEAAAKAGADLAVHVATLGHGWMVENIDASNTALAEAVVAERVPPTLTRAVVAQANAAGQELLLQTVARVLGVWSGGTAEEIATRTTLLEIVIAQDAAIREHRARRRTVPDVDPNTGKEGEAPEEDLLVDEPGLED